MPDDKKKDAAPASPDGGAGKKNGNLFLTIGIVVGILIIYAPVTYFPVSYTHLDVYKRQAQHNVVMTFTHTGTPGE
ncbi:hypothetical protein R84B8_01502 [Treponema sp. R8-4-B8]